VKRETAARNAALLSALLLLDGVLAPLAHAGVLTTGVLSTGNHRVVVDSLELMDLGGGIARYRTEGEWSGDTMVVDTFFCTPEMDFFPTTVLLWGALDSSPFTRHIAVPVVPDTWYIIPSTPLEAMVRFTWRDDAPGVDERGRPRHERAGLTVGPSIVRAGATIRAERVPGTSYALVLYDAVGSRVRTLRTRASSGTATVTWNGEDDSGHRLPEGIYYCRLGDAANSTVRKVVLTR
jgi:hypothetical protein